jgi:PKD repeat protein
MLSQNSKSNNIRTSFVGSGLTGVQTYAQAQQYSVDLGTILYNNSFKSLNSLVIPLKDQTFFDLPQDKGKYAVINVYYDAENGNFVFDEIYLGYKYVEKLSAPALYNVIPLAQFTLQESQGSYIVVSYNEYSQMATFSITDTFIQGDTGIKAAPGETGPEGITGLFGSWGWTGVNGVTGDQGLTGLSATGINGLQGETGVYVDKTVLLYHKFKTADAKQTDYSFYERDCIYQYTGPNANPNYTGTYGVSGSPLSYYYLESGVVDYCHEVVYGGGLSQYIRNEFVEFGVSGSQFGVTGTLSAWIKLTEKPIAGFTGTLDSINPMIVHFHDTSTQQPTSWTWWMDYLGQSVVLNMQNPIYAFPVTGMHIVKLRATNLNGYSEICHFVNL